MAREMLFVSSMGLDKDWTRRFRRRKGYKVRLLKLLYVCSHNIYQSGVPKIALT